ncbi:MAG: hypothetical protein ACU0CI_02605, partial [Shimia sp.]
MFDTAPPETLKPQIDRFEVPTFVAEREDPRAPYHILALNAAHERVSGMSHPGPQGVPLAGLLPPDQARIVEARYAACTGDGLLQNYSERLTMPSGICTWNTTLHPVPCADRRERLIGVAVLTHHMETEMCDIAAFEDIQYVAAGAMLRLGQVTTLMDAVERGERRGEELAQGAMLLASICASVEAALRDLRTTADARLAARQDRPALLGEATTPNADDLEDAMQSLISIIEPVLPPLKVA